MNRVSERTHPSPRNRTSPLRNTDRALDADRSRSMADEGCCSGAAMELREQLADAQAALRQPRMRAALQSHALWGVAGAAAGLLFGVLLWRRWA